jgi:FkbM family methyltransferase
MRPGHGLASDVGQRRAARPTDFALSPGVVFQAFDRPDTRALYEEIFTAHVYEAGALAPAPLIVDCGANVGLATAWFTARYRGCTVLAFEPEPEALAVLRANVAANAWRHVTVVGAAVAGTTGNLTLYVDPDRPAPPRASLLVERMCGPRIDVPGVRLSDYVPADGVVDLLKMDIEGAEAAVVAELADTGRLTRIRRITMEFHHNVPSAGRLSETLQTLERAGFSYTIRARRHTDTTTGFQNIMIYAGRPAPG